MTQLRKCTKKKKKRKEQENERCVVVFIMPQALLESRKARKLMKKYCCFGLFKQKYLKWEMKWTLKHTQKNIFVKTFAYRFIHFQLKFAIHDMVNLFG